MNLRFKLLLAILAALLLSGCAGRDFVRPPEGELTLGQSTMADVTKKLGTPRQTGELTKNEQQLKTSTYVYATVGGESAYPGVTPARAMTFTFFKDKLASQEFVSSFKSDSTNFDGSKVGAIVKGKTTRPEVIALLGKPGGEAIYPVIKGSTDRASIYTYSHAKGSAFNMKFYRQILIVSFNNEGVVSDVEYTTAGEK